MNRSGIKRGMAALAISAVAVTGIPALASATSIDTQVTAGVSPTGVQLYNTPLGGGGALDMTAKPDGTDSTVRLEAGAGINVPQVTFQVRRNGIGVYADIATVSRNDDGAFSYEWTPANNGAFAGDTLEIRVLNTAAPANFEIEGPFTLRLASSVNTQAINIAAGTNKGYFTDPCFPLTDWYVGITGTTSVTSIDPADRPGLAWMNGAGVEQDFTFNTSNGGDGTFEGTLDISAYIFDNPLLPPADPDQIVIRAATDTAGAMEDDTDDFEAFTLYEQTITSVTAVIGTAIAPDPAPVLITVLDQNSRPVANVDVRNALGGFVGLTDGRGETVAPQNNAIAYYYANADCPTGFSPGAGDVRSNDVNNSEARVTIASSPEGNVAVGSSVTETITVRDSNGVAIANRGVLIRRNGPGSEAETVFRTTNNSGVATYTFTGNTRGNAAINVSIDGPGNPGTFVWATAFDNVQFGPTRVAIQARLRAPDNGARADRITVITQPNANGARTKLWTIRNGNKVVVATGRLNSNGSHTFVRSDNNGNDQTRYFATVNRTSDTKAARTNTRKIR